ncbi:MAG: ABC transporter permease [Prolixibacteraceae bacterium]|nr:ABC transporter permease [Prolixibacteraceae bacterium]
MKTLSLSSRNFKEIYRDPLTISLGLALPVLLMILFSSIFKRAQVEIFSPTLLTPGVLIFSFSFIIMFSSVLISKDKENSFLTRLFTTPLKPSHFILAYMLPYIPFALTQTLICILTGVFLGADFQNILPVLGIFFLISFTCICMGVTLGALLSVNQVSAVGSLLITVISLFSGAWMDLHMVGGLFETIGYALPFAHAIDAAKILLRGGETTGIMKNLFPVIAYTVVFFFTAILSFRKTIKRG